MNTDRPLLMNEHDAANRCGLSVKTLRNWRLSGKGPPYLKLGGAVRYRESDLDAFLDKALRLSTSDTGQH